ncbi:MAG: hypothetical protein LUH20_01640 [Lachnospiraceae bacterium]|nr:hypothetical protein [Lachnospiraceae bacterium]
MKRKMALFLAAALAAASVTPTFASESIPEDSAVIVEDAGEEITEESTAADTPASGAESTEDAPLVVSAEEYDLEEDLTSAVEEDTDDTESTLTQLDTPTNLQWGVTDSGESFPGNVCWTVGGALTQNQYRVTYYKVEASGDTVISQITINYGSTSEYQVLDTNNFTEEIRESGTYYFTVQALGDGTTYSDSEIAVSDTWTYVQPTEQFAAPGSFVWIENDSDDSPVSITWASYEDETYLYGYYVEFYVSDQSDGTGTSRVWGYVFPKESGNSQELGSSDFAEGGNGYYYARVRAISNDITVCLTSEWSELSSPYYFNDVYEGIAEQLAAIDSSASESEIRTSVQAIDTDELAAAMAADQDNTGVAAQVESLEAQAGVKTVITVTEDMAATFDSSQISVIGGGLNTSSGDAELTVDVPKSGDVIDTQYKNAVAFSMNLTGEDVDSNALSVPVKITLPVPSTINPDFLVILHYHQGETEPEQIWPNIYEENGQYYATFVITSFSDFVMYEDSAADISEFSITLSADSFTYDGTPKTPAVTVSDGTITLTEGTDYTVAYGDNTEAGTATVTITGIGDYEGTLTASFTIVAETETESETETETETETESETETETETETESESETETEPESEVQTEAETGAEQETTLLLAEDGNWYYCVNGETDTSYSGIAAYDGASFFVANGVLCSDAHGLNLFGDTWYFLAYGQIQTQYTGLALYDGEWFYIKEGVLDTTVNGLIPYDGEQFLFAEGRLLLSYSGLWLNSAEIGGDDQWYFIAAGMVQNVSQVALYDGEWFVVKDGILDTSYNGTIEYDGATFHVKDGQLYS